MKEVLMNNKWPILIPDHREKILPWDVWEFYRLKEMHKWIKPGDTLIDVGAATGEMSALLAKWVGKSGRTILIEPSKRCWYWLKKIWESNNLKKPILMFNGFAADKSINPELSGEWPSCCNDAPITIQAFSHLSGDSLKRVPRVTLDQVFEKITKISKETNHWKTRRGRINIITIDVEGSEFEVLVGARDILFKQNPIVFVSIHPAFMWHQYNHHIDDILRYMRDLGYRGHYIHLDHEVHFMFKKEGGYPNEER